MPNPEYKIFVGKSHVWTIELLPPEKQTIKTQSDTAIIAVKDKKDEPGTKELYEWFTESFLNAPRLEHSRTLKSGYGSCREVEHSLKTFCDEKSIWSYETSNIPQETGSFPELPKGFIS